MPGFIHDEPRKPVIVLSNDGEERDVSAAFDSLVSLLVCRTYGYCLCEHGAVYARVNTTEELDFLLDWCRAHTCAARQLISHNAPVGDRSNAVYLIDLTAYKE